VKPFALVELLARIHAVLRRSMPRLSEIRFGETVIDFRQLRAFVGSREIARATASSSCSATWRSTPAPSSHGRNC
jgi:DNA-binding response OmpR family regulator